MIFDPAGEGQSDPVDLRGNARAPRRFVGWQTFFDFGAIPGRAAPASSAPTCGRTSASTRLSTPLFNLPLQTIAGGVPGTPQSLAQRNLLRQVTWSMPSSKRSRSP